MADCSEREQKAEGAAGDQGEEAPANKMHWGEKRAEGGGRDQGEEAPAKKMEFYEGEKDQREVAAPPAKKMWRLPKEEITWIMSHANEPVCGEFRDLKIANPSLLPSPEEAKDKSIVLLYKCARDAYEDEERFAVFQAWVRREYASKGFTTISMRGRRRRGSARRRGRRCSETGISPRAARTAKSGGTSRGLFVALSEEWRQEYLLVLCLYGHFGYTPALWNFYARRDEIGRL